MAKTLIVVSPDDNNVHLFDKFTAQFKKLKGKFDVVFLISKRNYKYFMKLTETKFKVLKNSEECLKELEQAISNKNLAREYFITNKNYDHILFLDSDMILPRNILVKLLEKDKEIITAAYLNFMIIAGEKIFAPPIYKVSEHEGFLNLLRPEALIQEMMIEVGAAALSCCLVKRDVIERVSFRKPYKVLSESISFFEDAVKKLGFKAWVDTSIQCYRQPFPDSDKRNRAFVLEKVEEN